MFVEEVMGRLYQIPGEPLVLRGRKGRLLKRFHWTWLNCAMRPGGRAGVS